MKGRCLNRLTMEPHSPSRLTPRVGLEPTTTRLTAECSAIELLRIIPAVSRACLAVRLSFAPLPAVYQKGFFALRFGFKTSLRFALLPLIQIEGIIAYPLIGSRRRPILPDRFQSSTFGAKRLNFCVRYGYRWDPLAIVTGISLRHVSCPLHSLWLRHR